MYLVRRALWLITLLLTSAPSVCAQTPDPSGHWTGSIASPTGEIGFQIDLTRDASGDLRGTFSLPEEQLKRYPLSRVRADGEAVTFELTTSGGGTFEGLLVDEGKTMAGEFASQLGNAPFNLKRTGAANIEAPPRSAPISKALEGTWSGALDIEGTEMRVVLKLANQPDGTSSGRIISVDEGNAEMPVAIREDAASVTIDVAVTGGSYAAAISSDGSRLEGTYRTGRGFELPLILKHVMRSAEVRIIWRAAPSAPKDSNEMPEKLTAVDVPSVEEVVRDSEAEFRLEYPARCPNCGEEIRSVKVIRLLRTRVNFVSTLPRHGRVLTCPLCRGILGGELTVT